MSAGIEQRLIELETRLAFQERTVTELSDALAETRLEVARMSDSLRVALEALKQPRGEFYADPAAEPPPPHY